jgi:hypothetical protein
MKGVKNICVIRPLVGILRIAAWLLAPAAKANAETLAGANVDQYINVALHVSPEKFQHWLPVPWVVNPNNKGGTFFTKRVLFDGLKYPGINAHNRFSTHRHNPRFDQYQSRQDRRR